MPVVPVIVSRLGRSTHLQLSHWFPAKESFSRHQYKTLVFDKNLFYRKKPILFRHHAPTTKSPIMCEECNNGPASIVFPFQNHG